MEPGAQDRFASNPLPVVAVPAKAVEALERLNKLPVVSESPTILWTVWVVKLEAISSAAAGAVVPIPTFAPNVETPSTSNVPST